MTSLHLVDPMPQDPRDPMVMSRLDVTQEIALEKARRYHAIFVQVHEAAQQYGDATAKQMVRDALILEFGSGAL